MILDQLGITSRKSKSQLSLGTRETIINLSFIIPFPEQIAHSKACRRVAWIYYSVTLAQILSLLGIALVMAMHHLIAGVILMGCMTTTLLSITVLHWCSKLTFANLDHVIKDCQRGVEGGAALDVHLVALNWNSSCFDVICGYSSHLHALTNLPARINKPKLLTWVCRILAITLTLQATVLAGLLLN